VNKKSIKKWLSEIIAFANDKNIWVWNTAYKKWEQTNLPSFSNNLIYVIEDQHFKARKAFAEGKLIEYLVPQRQGWTPTTTPHWQEGFKYRPKSNQWYNNIPEKGILCWVWNNELGGRKKEARYIKWKKSNDFICIEEIQWKHAEPVKSEECFQQQNIS